MRHKENFKAWGFCANLLIDGFMYLDALLSCWLCGHAFTISSTKMRSEIFLIAVEMSKGIRYNLAIPHLVLLYRILGNFSDILGEEEDLRALDRGSEMVIDVFHSDLWFVTCQDSLLFWLLALYSDIIKSSF